MLEFQSNVFHYQYHLPPPLAMGSYSFCCAVDCQPTRLFEVKVKPGYSINELKGAIREKLNLEEVSVSQICLWKVNLTIHPTLDTVEETNHFADQILHLDLDSDNPHSAVQLKYPTKKVLSYWKNKPPPECLHLIVRLECLPILTSKRSKRPSMPEDEGRERKRTCKSWNPESDIPNEGDYITKNLLELHRLFWGVSESPLFTTNHVKIPDARSLKITSVKRFETINLPHPVRFPDGSSTLIITEIYKTFREQLHRDDDAWEQVQRSNMPFADPSHSSVVSGQPGIGKTVFLNDILVHRLQAKMVTIFCNARDCAHVFSGSGVRRVSLSRGARIPELDTNPRSCALVNLGVRLLQPPEQFYPSYRLGRVVIASSLDPVHVTCFKEHPALTYYMPTWDWDNLYCGSLVHVGKVPSDTTRTITVEAGHDECLREAYWKFSGIPRLCYKAFKPKAMEDHLRKINTAIDNIRSIEEYARAMKGLLPFKQEASHNLIRTEPVPDTHWMESRSELKSSFIAELVFQQVCLHQTIKLSEDISGLLLNPDSRGHAGRLFEPAAHRSLEKGMRIKPTPITPKAPYLVFDIHKANPNVNRRFYTLSVRAAPRSQTAHTKYFGQYLLPISKTQESINALVIYQYYTVFLQMTVSKKHCIKLNGILDLIKELPANAKKKLYIVFVLPSDDKETQSFGPQNIIFPQGARAEDIALVSSIPQYVYRLPLKTVNELCMVPTQASLDI